MEANRIPTVGRKKKLDPFSVRLDLRSTSEWMDRVEIAAARKGLTVSSYIRMKISECMDADGIPKPPPKKKPKAD